MATKTDIERVSKSLKSVVSAAKSLDWAQGRPWTTATHIWDENGVVVVDLHDLNAKLAKAVIGELEHIADRLVGGGLIFITGQGRHSMGVPVIKKIATGMLIRMEGERGWRSRDLGAGRMLLVVDESRIPGRYRRATPVWVPAFFILFCGGLAWSVPPNVGLPLVAVALWFGVSVWRAGRRPKLNRGE
jgi:hypothetical protein